MAGVLLFRPLLPQEVRCPAGNLVGDCDVECKIEQGVIEGRLNPESVGGFCCGEYTSCRTWQAARKVEEMGGDLQKIIASQKDAASRLRNSMALREARMRRIRELITEDSPEGRAFRERYRRVMAAAEAG